MGVFTSAAMMEADSLMVVDSKRTANSRPLSFQLSLLAIRMFLGVRFLWMSLQMTCRKLSASRIWPQVSGSEQLEEIWAICAS